MSDLDNYLKLKSKVDKSRSQLAKAQGVHESLVKRLKDEFKSESLDIAQKKLTKLDNAIDSLQGSCDAALLQFNEKFGEALEKIG